MLLKKQVFQYLSLLNEEKDSILGSFTLAINTYDRMK